MHHGKKQPEKANVELEDPGGSKETHDAQQEEGVHKKSAI